jgi:hypothetical protein
MPAPGLTVIAEKFPRTIVRFTDDNSASGKEVGCLAIRHVTNIAVK